MNIGGTPRGTRDNPAPAPPAATADRPRTPAPTRFHHFFLLFAAARSAASRLAAAARCSRSACSRSAASRRLTARCSRIPAACFLACLPLTADWIRVAASRRLNPSRLAASAAASRRGRLCAPNTSANPTTCPAKFRVRCRVELFAAQFAPLVSGLLHGLLRRRTRSSSSLKYESTKLLRDNNEVWGEGALPIGIGPFCLKIKDTCLLGDNDTRGEPLGDTWLLRDRDEDAPLPLGDRDEDAWVLRDRDEDAPLAGDAPPRIGAYCANSCW